MRREMQRRAVDAQVLVAAHYGVGIAYVVGVVVGQHYALNHRGRHTVAAQRLKHVVGVYARVDQHSAVAGAQIRAVAAAAASKTCELQFPVAACAGFCCGGSRLAVWGAVVGRVAVEHNLLLLGRLAVAALPHIVISCHFPVTCTAGIWWAPCQWCGLPTPSHRA